ncbi:hypothetical protein L226DRAFT_539738 [Lentinus tigrinus ALCF2SS1-7]|uniref:DUF6699 domain-containing protein n=1 Tax=Lentinus tigrinus ALCF2SS1-6 TaxID=1328759 RepID=A0A5C2S908_9APHY|nr:hypothetical protein L227DRAFT_575369 [Lentinus tigrinus ALCF2SS1-6]RPD69555.1 hypothetical protein L226DRAFT_539738 [Lentinus tigrinus ALCF2SS1-7]
MHSGSPLRLLAAPRSKGPSHSYPRHYNPRHIPYPFDPASVVPPPTPLLRPIDLPAQDSEEEYLPTSPILLSPLPTLPASNYSSILMFDAPLPSPSRIDKTHAHGTRVHQSSVRHAPYSRPPPAVPPVRRSAVPAILPSGTSATTASASASDVPIVDALLAFPPHASAEPPFEWDIMRDPYKSLQDNMPIRHIIDLRRWVAIRAGPGGVPEPLTSLVLILEDAPGLEITVEHSVTPSFLPPAPWEVNPRAVIIYDLLGQLYRELREPLTREELAALGEEERVRLRDAADARVGYEFGCVVEAMHHQRERNRRKSLAYRDGCAHADPEHDESVPLRRIDRLGRRRRFLGIRPARRREVPAGREHGEVFVVELGMC